MELNSQYAQRALAILKGRIDRSFRIQVLRQPIVKVHGLLRVGTNYVEALVERNLRAVCLPAGDGGWKHGKCDFDHEKRFIFVVKNPYAWILSFHAWERHHKRTNATEILDFATQPIVHEQLRLSWGTVSAIEAWNVTLRSWLQYSDEPNVVFVRYEDILGDLDKALKTVAERLDIQPRSNRIVNITSRVDANRLQVRQDVFDGAFYKNQQYLRQLDEPTRERLRCLLDPALMARFGYHQ